MEESTREVPIGWQSDKALSESLTLLLENELWTDVTFNFKNQEEVVEVKGHTLILAARSPVFQAMFYGQMDSTREVKIEDASPEFFKLLLKCLYTDEVDIDENSLTRVIEIAHKYQVGYLLDLCSEELAKCIRVDNTCHILNLAVFYNLNELQKEARDFVDDHVHEILETPGFINISVETLRVILAGGTFYTDELNIFRKCMDSAENKCKDQNLEPHDQNKRNVLGDAFFSLRLPTLSLFDYTENVANTNLLSTEESHKVYMYKGSPSLQMGLRHSVIQRKPRLDTMLLPRNQMEIKFHCPNDIYLLGVTLDQSILSLQKDEKPSFNPESDEKEQPEKNLRYIELYGKIVIQETDLNVTFETEYLSKLPNFVSLDEKVFLKGKNEPYTVAVKAKVYTSYNVLYLERLRNICHNEDCSSKKKGFLYGSIHANSFHTRLRKILYKPWPGTEHFITGLQYQNVSNREPAALNS